MIIIYKERVNKHGVTKEFMKGIGKIIRCMELEHLNGQMEESKKVNIKMIKNKELELLHGQMVENK